MSLSPRPFLASRPGTMGLWSLCFILFVCGLRLLGMGAGALVPRSGRERMRLREVGFLLQELEETLAAGLVPATPRWAALQALPAPWGELAFESLQELRACGGALLPTLRRLRTLAQEQTATLAEARARSSQALAQAMVCSLLVPAFGAALYYLMPAIEVRGAIWLVACTVAAGWAGLGALWMLRLADQARWAGLPQAARPWMLASQCAGERFLALVRSGNPADLAWTRAGALLRQEAAGLADRWGASVWKPAESEIPTSRHRVAPNGAIRALEEAGAGLRKAVQVSLMEGRPCTERVENALAALRVELRAQVERELSLLPTRALKPLFACVAPAVLGLLACGLWLSWQQAVTQAGFGF